MSSEIENEFLAELNHAAKPLLKLGLHDSSGEFIKDVTSNFIKHKIQACLINGWELHVWEHATPKFQRYAYHVSKGT